MYSTQSWSSKTAVIVYGHYYDQAGKFTDIIIVTFRYRNSVYTTTARFLASPLKYDYDRSLRLRITRRDGAINREVRDVTTHPLPDTMLSNTSGAVGNEVKVAERVTPARHGWDFDKWGRGSRDRVQTCRSNDTSSNSTKQNVIVWRGLTFDGELNCFNGNESNVINILW